MPVINKIIIRDFRNIALQELEFSPKINCICGGNGEGKTNLLDAIWYLSMTKSAFAGAEHWCFRHGAESFEIGARCTMENGLESRFAIKATRGGEKTVRRDDKAYSRISLHIGTLPVVMVSPADISLVSESGDERRRFANSVLSQTDHSYLEAMQQYNRLLLQRNRLLKDEAQPDEDLLAVFDAKLGALAGPIYEKRREFCSKLVPLAAEYYGQISGGREKVNAEYRSDLSKAPLEELLRNSREKDRFFKYTSVGIQRDDFLFTMDGYPIRRCGSQGQQKSFLVALKFAQRQIMNEDGGIPPALLLDDLFDKLDTGRVSNLLSMVSSEGFGQIFITDTGKERLGGIVDGIDADSAFFKAEGGAFSRYDG
ncbi:MAG: DNA replication and repair protein RecF [Bacteroidales bacterium]|nr:DNA replication and repair protein RecF [Bacteroidales bacterium]